MKKITILQSNRIPWIEYFDLPAMHVKYIKLHFMEQDAPGTSMCR